MRHRGKHVIARSSIEGRFHSIDKVIFDVEVHLAAHATIRARGADDFVRCDHMGFSVLVIFFVILCWYKFSKFTGRRTLVF